VNLVDANVLLYAYNSAAPQHAAARAWLEGAFSDPRPVALSWSGILAFVRIATHPRAVVTPLSVVEAAAIVDSWLALPQVVVLEAGARHWAILRGLLEGVQARGNLVTDAHLATLALEHGASLCTTDADFALFERHGLRLVDPRAAAVAP
jgi:hypothetical protein